VRSWKKDQVEAPEYVLAPNSKQEAV
jgi:Na+-transporting NADH:ubiquinone oxidoreductase subunit D